MQGLPFLHFQDHAKMGYRDFVVIYRIMVQRRLMVRCQVTDQLVAKEIVVLPQVVASTPVATQ